MIDTDARLRAPRIPGYHGGAFLNPFKADALRTYSRRFVVSCPFLIHINLALTMLAAVWRGLAPFRQKAGDPSRPAQRGHRPASPINPLLTIDPPSCVRLSFDSGRWLRSHPTSDGHRPNHTQTTVYPARFDEATQALATIVSALTVAAVTS